MLPNRYGASSWSQTLKALPTVRTLSNSLKFKRSWRCFVFVFVALILTIQFLSVMYIKLSYFNRSGTNNRDTLEFQQLRESLATDSLSYKPAISVAFAIPVGGRTQRAVNLDQIITNLLSNGVPPQLIYIMEDRQSRPGVQNSVEVGQVAEKHNVAVVSSTVIRDETEDYNTFGRYLARHYKFMFDFLLVGDLPENQEILAKFPDRQQNHAFATIIEDDLVLGTDFVKFFHEMSRVMRVDKSVYCVSAHQDNAFPGTCSEPKGSELDPLDFDIRRGNHFMAPGFMISRENYVDLIRENWLDSNGIYKFKERLRLKNGHWDRFFDSLIGQRDCIFPEIPRITHNGADGFTVDKKGQMELYANLKLSQLSPAVNYGDLTRFTRAGYIAQTEEFIRRAHRLNVLEESLDYQRERLVYVVAASSDKDNEWNEVINKYFGLIGVGGYGGYEGYVKVRGIFHGAVFIRWFTNLILLVGNYSPYMNLVDSMSFVEDGIELGALGCYRDTFERDLPHLIPHYTPNTLSPRKCLNSCLHLGYEFAGLQNGQECFCGSSYGRHKKHDDQYSCSRECKGNGNLNIASRTWQAAAALFSDDSYACGGGFANSIYTNKRSKQDGPQSQRVLRHIDYLNYKSAAMEILKGGADESCTVVCEKQGKLCNEQLFPLITDSCARLGSVEQCNSCVNEEDIERGIATSSHSSQDVCYFSKGRYFNCPAKPVAGFNRICVCENHSLT
jgi:hypothetical protein